MRRLSAVLAARRLVRALAAALFVVAIAAPGVGAKEGVEVSLAAPLPADAEPGSTVPVFFRLVTISDTSERPLVGSPVFIRLILVAAAVPPLVNPVATVAPAVPPAANPAAVGASGAVPAGAAASPEPWIAGLVAAGVVGAGAFALALERRGRRGRRGTAVA